MANAKMDVVKTNPARTEERVTRPVTSWGLGSVAHVSRTLKENIVKLVSIRLCLRNLTITNCIFSS